jgi:polar amino acid transport system permease protein
MNQVNRHLRSTARKARPLPTARARNVDCPPDEMLTGAESSVAIYAPMETKLTYSESTAPLRRLGRLGRKIGVLGAKLGYLAVIAWLIWTVGRGVFGLNFEVIADNLRTLLIFRFPKGTAADLWGLGGLSLSIIMAVIAISASFVIGLGVGMGRLSSNKILRVPCLLYIEIIRGNPLILVIFWVYFFIPVLTGQFISVLWSATIALTIFTGAYLAETVRSGIQNIPTGQVEAAISTGLSYWQTMRKIILPQALKQMLPAIVGLFIAIFKDTSLAYIIGVLELTFVAQGLSNRLMVYPFEVWSTVAVLYFVCCYSMSRYAGYLERKLSPERMSLEM